MNKEYAPEPQRIKQILSKESYLHLLLHEDETLQFQNLLYVPKGVG